MQYIYVYICLKTINDIYTNDSQFCWEILLYIDLRPRQTCHSKTVEVHIPLLWASLADNMEQGKIPRYSHRLMHRKRVTCELHDSYFCSMPIKHVIPRTAEVTHPDGKLWGDIEWAIELLYITR